MTELKDKIDADIDKYAVPDGHEEEAGKIQARLNQSDTYVSNPSDSTDLDFDEGKSEAISNNSPRSKYCMRRYLILYYTAVFLIAAALIFLPLYFFTDAFRSADNNPSSSPRASFSSSSSTTGALAMPSPTKSPDISTTAPINEGGPTFDSVLLPSPSDISGESSLSPCLSLNRVPSLSLTVADPRIVISPVDISPTLLDTISWNPFSPTSKPTALLQDPHLPASSSGSPTSSPITDAPSVSPTKGAIDVTETSLFRFLAALFTPQDTLADDKTPQGKAVRWLVEKGVQQISAFRVPQRYALVALDFAFHQGNSSNFWRNSSEDICDWQGITCDNVKNVIGVKWNNQGLEGTILPEIKLLDKLQTLDLAQNNIEGTLDPFWELKNLTHLYLFENRISGPIPDTPAPSALKKVYLGHNLLNGSLPLGLASDHGPRELEYLILHHNNLSGDFPKGMRMRYLFYLDLSFNNFTGSIPIDWSLYLVRLRIMYLDHNSLSGDLQSDFSQIGNGRMKQVYVNDNRFTGEFPTGWGDYTMTNLNLANNSFTKRIARNICNISVFKKGELVELRTDCEICDCDVLCDICIG